MTRSFDIFFDLRLNQRFSKQSWGLWFETPSRPLCRHCNGFHLMTSSWRLEQSKRMLMSIRICRDALICNRLRTSVECALTKLDITCSGTDLSLLWKPITSKLKYLDEKCMNPIYGVSLIFPIQRSFQLTINLKVKYRCGTDNTREEYVCSKMLVGYWAIMSAFHECITNQCPCAKYLASYTTLY